MTDQELVRAIQAGDRGAFDMMVRLHHRPVYNMAYRFMADHGGADDVTQDTFLKAFHAIGSFRGESSLKSWLLRIASNTAKNALRSRNLRPMVDVEDTPLAWNHTDYQRLEKMQTGEILKAAIERLPPKQKQALELRIYEDLAFKEIAEIMDAPFDTAKANFRHALINLKKVLESADQGRGLEELKRAFESLSEDLDNENLV